MVVFILPNIMYLKIELLSNDTRLSLQSSYRMTYVHRAKQPTSSVKDTAWFTFTGACLC